MSQQALFVWMFALGLLFQVGACRQKCTWFAACMAFPSGLALTVMGALPIIVTGGDVTLLPMAGILVPVAALLGVMFVHDNRPSRRQVWELVAALALFALAVVAICSIDSSKLTRDSGTILDRAGALARGDAAGAAFFRMKGTLTPVAYSLARLASESYLYGLAPVSGFALLLLFGAAGWVFARRQPQRRGLAVGLFVLAALASMTTYMMLFHSFYVHTNLHAALYLFAVVVAVYAAGESRDRYKLAMIPLFLTAYALTRVEGYLFALVVAAAIAPYLASVSVRGARAVFAAWGVSMLLWFAYMLTLPPAEKLTDDRVEYSFAVIIAGAAALAFYPRVRLLRWAVERARVLVPLALAACIVAACVFRWWAMEISFDVTWRNLLYEKRMWGYSWNIVFLLVPVMCLAPVRPGERLFREMALVISMSMIAIASVHPYRFGIGDSGNRMMVQVLPLAFVSLAIAAWRLLDTSPGARSMHASRHSRR